MLNNCEAIGLGCVLTLPIYRGREQHGNGREAGDKGTGSGRVRYGRREVLTPLSRPTEISTKPIPTGGMSYGSKLLMTRMLRYLPQPKNKTEQMRKKKKKMNSILSSNSLS